MLGSMRGAKLDCLARSQVRAPARPSVVTAIAQPSSSTKSHGSRRAPRPTKVANVTEAPTVDKVENGVTPSGLEVDSVIAKELQENGMFVSSQLE
jgi:hypothetical protein